MEDIRRTLQGEIRRFPYMIVNNTVRMCVYCDGVNEQVFINIPIALEALKRYKVGDIVELDCVDLGGKLLATGVKGIKKHER